MNEKTLTRIYAMTFASVYPHYITKAERKWRTQAEVDEIIYRLTGYDQSWLALQISQNNTFKQFFEQAPQINPKVSEIKGVICWYRIEDIQDPLMKKIRYLDKLIDELTKGRPMDKILRK